MTVTKAKNRVNAIGGEVPTNGAASRIEACEPYIVDVRIKGTADLIFHRWNCDEIAESAAKPKGSKGKKLT